MALPAAGAAREETRFEPAALIGKGTKLEAELRKGGRTVAPVIASDGVLNVWIGTRASDHVVLVRLFVIGESKESLLDEVLRQGSGRSGKELAKASASGF